MAQNVLVVADLSSDLCRNDCLVFSDPQLASGAFLSAGAALRRLAAPDLLAHAACGIGGKRPRSPAEYSDGGTQSSFSFSLLQHELPHRTSHVPDGAIPRSPQTPRTRGSVSAPHLWRPPGCVSRNCPRADPPVERRKLLRVEGASAITSARRRAGRGEYEYGS